MSRIDEVLAQSRREAHEWLRANCADKDPCVWCGHSLWFHGGCGCHAPKSCIQHMGVCQDCGCREGQSERSLALGISS